MSDTIVTVAVSQEIAPTPSTLQKTGAFISQGGTTLSPGTYQLLTSAATLATYIEAAQPMTALAWSGEVVTVTVSGGHRYPVGKKLWVVIAGAVPAGYNGTFYVTVTSSTQFTYTLVSNPGAETTLGVYVPLSANQLSQMNTTFWAQGSNVPVYVLELGPGNTADGCAMLQAFIAVNNAPQFFYSYLVPRYWDGDPTFIAMVATFSAPSSKTYFFTTTTLSTYALYPPTSKAFVCLVEAPAMAITQPNVVTELLSEPVAPTLGESAGGVLPARTYFVRVTYMTAFGETLPSPESTEAISLDNILTVTSPPAMTGATGYNVYVGTTAGSEELQNASPVAIGTPWDEPTSGLIVGATVPTAGFVVATTTSAHGVAVGQWFQLSGFTPLGYNGWWQAVGGTAGSALVFLISTNPGPETALGSLDANFITQSAPPPTEFTLAASFYDALRYNPSAANLMTPFAFSYQFGVTPWVSQGTSTILSQLKAAATNYITTGAEGGLASNLILRWGMTKDSEDFMEWYSADWAQVNYPLALANTVINGSNDPLNPLYYDQNGINSLQDTCVRVSQTAVSFGLANGKVVQSQLTGTALADAIEAGTFDGQIVVNAVPFVPYLQASPSDYSTGTYNGIGIRYIVNRGFISIQINLVLSNLPIQ